MSLYLIVGLVFLAVIGTALLRRGERGPTAPGWIDPERASVQELVLAGQKIQAIKRYREENGVGLKEAKEAVEEIARRLPGR
ncbi:MAG: ribosomal protein L7/L12 [bacterium]|nr:ribosomal protein L7/L12 [Gemmatimonadota bacterium]